MMKNLKFYILCSMLFVAMGSFVACGGSTENPDTQAPYEDDVDQNQLDSNDDLVNPNDSSMERNIDRAGNSLQDAGENLIDSVKDAGNAIKDGVDDITNNDMDRDY